MDLLKISGIFTRFICFWGCDSVGEFGGVGGGGGVVASSSDPSDGVASPSSSCVQFIPKHEHVRMRVFRSSLKSFARHTPAAPMITLIAVATSRATIKKNYLCNAITHSKFFF